MMLNSGSFKSLSTPASDNRIPGSDLLIGLVGAGAIGKHHARILKELLGDKFVGITDTDTDVGMAVSKSANVPFIGSLQRLLECSDAVVLATPTATHFEIASTALSHGKHILIEKPLADCLVRAKELVALAKRNRCHCVVGHVERFNPVIRWFKKNVCAGQILSINVTRVGPRPPRIKDVGILVDLAVHDIDLIGYLSESKIDQISAVSNANFNNFEDVAQICIRTGSGAVCGINTNWLTPYKSRKIEIATIDDFYVGDLVAGTVAKFQNSGPLGTNFSVERFSPAGREPLMEQACAFLKLVSGEDDKTENATVEQACAVVELAERCRLSSQQHSSGGNA